MWHGCVMPLIVVAKHLPSSSASCSLKLFPSCTACARCMVVIEDPQVGSGLGGPTLCCGLPMRM